MENLSMEEFKNAVQGKGIDDVIAKIKKGFGYEIYKMAVMDGDKDSAKTLQMFTMLEGLGNPEFSALMHSVSLEIMFSLADQKLRAEILGQEGM